MEKGPGKEDCKGRRKEKEYWSLLMAMVRGRFLKGRIVIGQQHLYRINLRAHGPGVRKSWNILIYELRQCRWVVTEDTR